MLTGKKKKFSSLSDEELEAIKTLKSNKNMVISKADKGNAIVILDRETYLQKAEQILKENQFKVLNNNNYHQEKENELNKYIYSLYKEGTIDKKLRFQLQSTRSSLSVFY